jgi:hypothetical protein
MSAYSHMYLISPEMYQKLNAQKSSSVLHINQLNQNDIKAGSKLNIKADTKLPVIPTTTLHPAKPAVTNNVKKHAESNSIPRMHQDKSAREGPTFTSVLNNEGIDTVNTVKESSTERAGTSKITATTNLNGSPRSETSSVTPPPSENMDGENNSDEKLPDVIISQDSTDRDDDQTMTPANPNVSDPPPIQMKKPDIEWMSLPSDITSHPRDSVKRKSRKSQVGLAAPGPYKLVRHSPRFTAPARQNVASAMEIKAPSPPMKQSRKRLRPVPVTTVKLSSNKKAPLKKSKKDERGDTESEFSNWT